MRGRVRCLRERLCRRFVNCVRCSGLLRGEGGTRIGTKDCAQQRRWGGFLAGLAGGNIAAEADPERAAPCARQRATRPKALARDRPLMADIGQSRSVGPLHAHMDRADTQVAEEIEQRLAQRNPG